LGAKPVFLHFAPIRGRYIDRSCGIGYHTRGMSTAK
jgi:hypothetical protein